MKKPGPDLANGKKTFPIVIMFMTSETRFGFVEIRIPTTCLSVHGPDLPAHYLDGFGLEIKFIGPNLTK